MAADDELTDLDQIALCALGANLAQLKHVTTILRRGLEHSAILSQSVSSSSAAISIRRILDNFDVPWNFTRGKFTWYCYTGGVCQPSSAQTCNNDTP